MGFAFRDIEIEGGLDAVAILGFRMIFVQVLQHLRQDFLQTMEGIERNATVNIACVLNNCLLILNFA